LFLFNDTLFIFLKKEEIKLLTLADVGLSPNSGSRAVDLFRDLMYKVFLFLANDLLCTQPEPLKGAYNLIPCFVFLVFIFVKQLSCLVFCLFLFLREGCERKGISIFNHFANIHSLIRITILEVKIKNIDQLLRNYFKVFHVY